MKTQLLETLENARNYTLAVAEAMPENSYQFTPAEDTMTFATLLHHIGYGISWWEENYIRQQSTDWNPPQATTDKSSTIAYLENAFSALKLSLANKVPTGKGLDGFYATIDHITHHRGQATVYLRCKGIVPPAYIY